MSSTPIRRAAAVVARLAAGGALGALSLSASAGVASVATLLLPAVVHAQVGSTTDIITGRVTGAQGQPLEGAQVTATSIETGTSRSRTTNAKGQYTILFPDGGGRYRVTVRAIGQRPTTVQVQRESDEDRLVANVKLGETTTTLTAVRVEARRQAPQGPPGGRPEPGGTERNISSEQALKLPVDAGDPNALASLTAGVVSQRGNDSTAAGFNVAGQRATQNNTTLDGVTFGGASFPQEAVRGTRVITNTFDVARGQFSGGQVASTTRAGTNNLYVGSTYNLRDPYLQWRPDFQGAFGQGFTQNSLSLGVGGPFVKDKAFYFGALSLSRRTDPLTSLLGADPQALQRIGTNADSVSRFLQQLQRLGIPTTAAAIPANRRNQNVTGIVRLDYNLTDEHTITLRGDYRYQGQDASRISPFAVPTNGGDATTKGGGLMATLASRLGREVFGGTVINELRVYGTGEKRAASPYLDLPGGRVRVTSQLEDGTTGVSSFAFGANPSLPNDGSTNYVESTEELSWQSPGGAHRVKLGGLVNASRYDQFTTFNPYGTYTYNSLQDFLEGRPAVYTRSLVPRQNQGGAVQSAAYLGDTWRKSRSFQLTYGVRLENSTYTGTPARNDAVAQTFGLRTDRFPGETHASPRIGFSYTHFPSDTQRTLSERQQQRLNQGGLLRGGPTFFVRGGIGEFRGRAPSQLYSAAQQGTGLAGGESQLVCVGAAIPQANFAAGATLPTQCLNVGTPTTPFQTGAAPTVSAFADDFQAPRSWRANLGVTRRFWERWTASVDGTLAWGVAQYGAIDRNLSATPKFTLGDEGGRPVYVPAVAIVPTTGASNIAASRVDPRFAQVLEINSRLRSRNAQVTGTIGGFTNKGVNFNLSYTLARNRDQSSVGFGTPAGFFSQTPTAGNPNVLGWAASNQDVRHNIIGNVTYPVNPSFEVTAVVRTTSGNPYTPIVSGDVNGDGASRNDAAFVYDPARIAATDPALAAGMQKVLASAPAAARECLTSQMGTIAGRNTCRAPWVPGLDMQLNYKPDRFGLKRRLTISTQLVNPLVGLDQLLHGSSNLRGWGQFVQPDPTLLAVRGFDAQRQRYVYEVNERFGSTRGLSQAFRQTFQVGIQARYVYGQGGGFFGGFGGGGDRGGPGGGMAAMMGGGGQGQQGGGLNFGGARANPIAQIIDLRDSLALDSLQVVKLEGVRDSLSARSTKLGEEVRAQIQKLGANPDPAVVFSTIRPRLNEGRTLIEQAMQQAQGILKPEQWAKVPENVKNPFRNVFGPGGGQGEQRRPPRQ